jgi:hypothetical protein
VRGTLLLSMGNSYCRAPAVARRQSARFFELRAGLSLAQLWRDQGKRREVRDLLVPIYGWFTFARQSLSTSLATDGTVLSAPLGHRTSFCRDRRTSTGAFGRWSCQLSASQLVGLQPARFPSAVRMVSPH